MDNILFKHALSQARFMTGEQVHQMLMEMGIFVIDGVYRNELNDILYQALCPPLTDAEWNTVQDNACTDPCDYRNERDTDLLQIVRPDFEDEDSEDDKEVFTSLFVQKDGHVSVSMFVFQDCTVHGYDPELLYKCDDVVKTITT